MADFKVAFQGLKKNEGGYVNDPDDAGGETYMGITRKNHPNSTMWELIDKIKQEHPKATNKELSTLIKQNPNVERFVEIIYKSLYWDVMNLDNMNSQGMSEQMFDMAVNSGVANSVKIAQRIVKMPETGKFNDELFKQLNKYGVPKSV
jgi:lysozyme family protein